MKFLRQKLRRRLKVLDQCGRNGEAVRSIRSKCLANKRKDANEPTRTNRQAWKKESNSTWKTRGGQEARSLRAKGMSAGKKNLEFLLGP